MQHDDLIWRSVDQGFCSFKVKTVKQNFCRNKYNVTGLCSRAGCPLANSRYATIMEHGECLYLFVKTAERAHSPRTLWQKIKLSANYKHALSQIDKHLEYWPEFYVHKAKQRLTKMVQYHIRRRRIALRTKTRLIGVKKKVERREKSREAKAVAAAKLDRSIEKELLERLQSGTYGDIYNFPQEQYEKVLAEEEEFDEDDEMHGDDMLDEYEADYESEDVEDECKDAELVEEYSDDENDSYDDIEDAGRRTNGLRRVPEFDFDADSDHDAGGSHSDIATGDAMARVRARAKRRGLSLKDQVGRGKKGRPIRRRPGSQPYPNEVEYEHEQERSTSRE